MPEEPLPLDGDVVAEPPVPKDGKDPGSKGQKVDRPQEPLRKTRTRRAWKSCHGKTRKPQKKTCEHLAQR